MAKDLQSKTCVALNLSTVGEIKNSDAAILKELEDVLSRNILIFN
jgi:hypothetical protein